MVAKVVEIQPKLSVFLRANDVAKLVDKTWPAIRREAHDLALVAVMRKSEKLRRSRVEDAGRVWILHLAQYVDRVVFACCPHRRDEISETVDRKQCCLFEWRHEEATGEMCTMMFDVVKTCSQVFLRHVEAARKFILQIAHFRSIAEPVFDLLEACMRSSEQDLLVQVRRWISRDADVVQVFGFDACCFETVSD